MARNCMLPLLLIRRHAETLLDNNKTEFSACMERAESLKDGLKGYDSARFKCISDYKNNLKTQIPLVNTMYEGYLKNFNVDGSLVTAAAPLN